MRSIRNEADLDTIACPRKYLRLGTFHKYYSGECKVPIPTVFIGGNHEASNYLWELYHGGWVCPGIYFLGFGGVINVGGLRISGMSGIYKSGHYEAGHYETFPLNDNHKRSIYHVRKYDVYKMQQIKEPMDIFLSHDWPLGIEQYGDVDWLLRKKKFFADEVRNNTLGSLAYEYVLTSLRPAHWFSAHLHVRFTAVVPWGMPAPRQTDSAMAPLNPVACGTNVAPEVKNPDEIEISMDDDDEDDEDDKDKKSTDNENKEQAAVVSNPDEIQIEMDDESEGEDGPALKLESQKAAVQQQQETATTTTSPSKEYPTCTKFLALDKCMEKRDYLEIIDFPEATGPVEFKYDEEWLAVVRTLDPFLTLDFSQRPPLQGDRLKHALEVNREWVRNNITLKRGLAIPDNFQPTAPAHDAVQTLGPQAKRECKAEAEAEAEAEVEVETEEERKFRAPIHTHIVDESGETEEQVEDEVEDLTTAPVPPGRDVVLEDPMEIIQPMMDTSHYQEEGTVPIARGSSKSLRATDLRKNHASGIDSRRRIQLVENNQGQSRWDSISNRSRKGQPTVNQTRKKIAKCKRTTKRPKEECCSEDESKDVVSDYNYETDEGIDSDEADLSEEEYLMQEFDWVEDDQDPDRKNQAPVLLTQPASEPEPEPP
ncbi:lariat debranching enzyme [Mortierella sp. GBA30]|nr:lariat debranching enzyme [Mortierella sp. GBA30]